MCGHSSLLAPPISEAKLRLRPSLDQARTWSTHSALRLRFALGARRIPVASRKPARAEEEDMFMYLFTLFFRIISHVILFGFPIIPPVVTRMSTLLVPQMSPLLWFPMVFYFLNVPPIVPRMSPTLPLPLSTRVSPSNPRVHYGLPQGAPQGLPEASLGAPGGTEAQNGFRIAFRCLFRSSSETRKID